MKVVPLGKRVLLKPKVEEEKTKGGIYIPDSAKENNKQGEVVAIGQFGEDKKPDLKEGDTVLYGGYGSDEVEMEGETYIIIDYKDILAKLK
ncbi:MAG: co-chaperone GroES [Nanoarchaeota archaeon]